MSDRRKSRTKDDGYFSIMHQKKKRKVIIIVSIIALVLVIALISVLVFSVNSKSENKFGALGSAHVHAAFIVKLNGTKIDFSKDKYQLKSRLIHVENGDGTTLHRHATNVPFSEFLRSEHMDINNGCFISDDNKHYCNNVKDSLKFFVNGNQTKDLMDYVFNDNDRILVLYGNENMYQIKQELDALRQTVIKNT